MRKSKTKKKKTKSKGQVEVATEVKGLILLSLSIALLLSLLSFTFPPEKHNWLGIIGHDIGQFFHVYLGLGSYLLTFYFLWISWRLLLKKAINRPISNTFSVLLLIFSACTLLSLLEDRYPSLGFQLNSFFYTHPWQRRTNYSLGGNLFNYLYQDLPGYNLTRIFNIPGTFILSLTALCLSLLMITQTSPAKFILNILHLLTTSFQKFWQFCLWLKPKKEKSFFRFVKISLSHAMKTSQSKEELLAIQPERTPKERPSLSKKQINEPTGWRELINSYKNDATQTQKEPETTLSKLPAKLELTPNKRKRAETSFSRYVLPPPSLLTESPKTDTSSLKRDLRKLAEVLEETLLSFNIEAKVGQINCGPTITSFEVHPAIGVKVQKIKSLENDIALNLEAKSIRIIAPIPGKAAIGIEVPNPQPQEVSYKEILLAYHQKKRSLSIPILLGKTVHGDYVMNDLAKMPHLIIAGATGSGKSVCINTIVMSILMNKRPDEVKLIMMDPKKVELTPYSTLPHMLAPVITEPKGALRALMWLVKEMEKRYDILKLLSVRNIEAFNRRTIDKNFEASLGAEIPEKMPYIVTIIDELADLMMVSHNDIEAPIARIAQMARAVGIHLILATQRPSREVITGLIKANFPTRISFKVSSRINSQIVLDETGAETLLGNGDMLFLPPGASHLIRAQGAFIRDEDISKTILHISNQAPTEYVINSFDLVEDDELFGTSKEEPKDALYEKAVAIVRESDNASTTFLQRKLKIGYARAASLIDELEDNSIISPADGSKPRQVLVARTPFQESEGEPQENLES